MGKEVGDPEAGVPADTLGDIRPGVSISESVPEILLRLPSQSRFMRSYMRKERKGGESMKRI